MPRSVLLDMPDLCYRAVILLTAQRHTDDKELLERLGITGHLIVCRDMLLPFSVRPISP